MFCYVLLCFAIFCYVIAMSRCVFALFCYVLLCFCYALLFIYYVLLCLAIICYVFARSFHVLLLCCYELAIILSCVCNVLLCFSYVLLCFPMFFPMLICGQLRQHIWRFGDPVSCLTCTNRPSIGHVRPGQDPCGT